ncbi:MAG: GtrA family protein [Oscillospiraceae bacterium]|jgi:putative flippase GtrA|nr:GtrA family protein [Oscillospiraceae bacterium]
MNNETIKSIFRKIINKETILYLIFGVLTTVINIAVYTLLNHYFKTVDLGSVSFFNVIFFGKPYLLSNAIAWLISVLFAFITNKLFVFESKTFASSKLFKEAVSFFGARIFSLLVEEAGLYLLMEMMHLNELAAKIILSFIVVVMNYFFSKLYIFKKTK